MIAVNWIIIVIGTTMDNKQKTLLKVVVPITIMIQLTAVIFLLNKDKAFNCRIYGEGAIACRQIKLP